MPIERWMRSILYVLLASVAVWAGSLVGSSISHFLASWMPQALSWSIGFIMACVTVGAVLLMCSGLLMRLLGGSVEMGRHPLDGPMCRRWIRVQALADVPHRFYLMRLACFLGPWRELLYLFQYPRVHRTARLGMDARISDPYWTTVGRDSFLGEGCLVTCHAIEGGTVHLAPVCIGERVVIGAKAVVFPGVVIEDDAVVASGAIVLKGSHIRQGEVWGGVPAVCIRGAGEKNHGR